MSIISVRNAILDEIEAYDSELTGKDHDVVEFLEDYGNCRKIVVLIPIKEITKATSRSSVPVVYIYRLVVIDSLDNHGGQTPAALDSCQEYVALKIWDLINEFEFRCLSNKLEIIYEHSIINNVNVSYAYTDIQVSWDYSGKC